MDYMEIIKSILHEKMDIDPNVITETTTFEDLQLDSLDFVELICSLEDKLDVDFGEPEDLNTVGDVIAYMNTLK